MNDSTYGDAVCDSKKKLDGKSHVGCFHRQHSDAHCILQRHDMEILSALLTFCEGNPHRSTVDSPPKGPVVWSLELTVNRQVSWRSFDIIVIRCLWQGIFCTMRFIYSTWTRSFGHVLVFDMVLFIFVYLGLTITQLPSKHCYLILHYMKAA